MARDIGHWPSLSFKDLSPKQRAGTILALGGTLGVGLAGCSPSGTPDLGVVPTSAPSGHPSPDTGPTNLTAPPAFLNGSAHDIYFSNTCPPGQSVRVDIRVPYGLNGGERFRLHGDGGTLGVDPETHRLIQNGHEVRKKKLGEAKPGEATYLVTAGSENVVVRLICNNNKPQVA